MGAGALGFVAALVVAAADGESGLRVWLEVRGDLASADRRVRAAEERVEALKSQVESLESDPFAVEQAIREDLGLARKREVIVRFPSVRGVKSVSTSRFP